MRGRTRDDPSAASCGRPPVWVLPSWMVLVLWAASCSTFAQELPRSSPPRYCAVSVTEARAETSIRSAVATVLEVAQEAEAGQQMRYSLRLLGGIGALRNQTAAGLGVAAEKSAVFVRDLETGQVRAESPELSMIAEFLNAVREKSRGPRHEAPSTWTERLPLPETATTLPAHLEATFKTDRVPIAEDRSAVIIAYESRPFPFEVPQEPADSPARRASGRLSGVACFDPGNQHELFHAFSRFEASVAGEQEQPPFFVKEEWVFQSGPDQTPLLAADAHPLLEQVAKAPIPTRAAEPWEQAAPSWYAETSAVNRICSTVMATRADNSTNYVLIWFMHLLAGDLLDDELLGRSVFPSAGEGFAEFLGADPHAGRGLGEALRHEWGLSFPAAELEAPSPEEARSGPAPWSAAATAAALAEGGVGDFVLSLGLFERPAERALSAMEAILSDPFFTGEPPFEDPFFTGDGFPSDEMQSTLKWQEKMEGS